MPKYHVTVPVDCCICVTVEADSKEEAKEVALNSDFNVELSGDGDPELETFSTVRRAHSGNVCYLTQWEIEVEEADW